jgi:isopentenyl-diphosphate delta-isomerase
MMGSAGLTEAPGMTEVPGTPVTGMMEASGLSEAREMTEADMSEEESVVLCAPDGSAAGTAPKSTVHGSDTPLHLAFSCYVFDPAGRVLVTRRAYDKRTFPGIRTNSCCGHPAPGEGMRIAVLRRLQHELGIVPSGLELILPAFRYRATAADGTVENELCPVYRAVTTTDVPVTVHPPEVHEAWWVPWAEFAEQVDVTDPLSVWGAQQVAELSGLGPDPLAWPAGEPALLPAAATP